MMLLQTFANCDKSVLLNYVDCEPLIEIVILKATLLIDVCLLWLGGNPHFDFCLYLWLPL